MIKIRELGSDVVAFQEVRGHEAGNIQPNNQLLELQLLLPLYKWVVYYPANHVSKVEDTYMAGWEKEGENVMLYIIIRKQYDCVACGQFK